MEPSYVDLKLRNVRSSFSGLRKSAMDIHSSKVDLVALPCILVQDFEDQPAAAPPTPVKQTIGKDYVWYDYCAMAQMSWIPRVGPHRSRSPLGRQTVKLTKELCTWCGFHSSTGTPCGLGDDCKRANNGKPGMPCTFDSVNCACGKKFCDGPCIIEHL